MIKLSATSAAALLLATIFAGPAHAYCDEDCAYERQEAAYERAYERSYQEDDEGYGRPSRGASRSFRRSKTARAEPQSEPRAAKSKSRTKTAGDDDTADEPKSAKRTKLGARNGAVKNENSSIAEGSTRLAEDDGEPVPRKSNKALGCRSYLPSVGQTVSVPCD